MMLVCVSVGATCALVGWLFGPLRHGVTVVHEAGHTLVALLMGRSVRAVRLHRDASGEAVSAGRADGSGVVATLLAGYPAPGLVGLAGLVAVSDGQARLWLVAAGVALALVAVLLRTAFGVLVLVVVAAGIAATIRWASPPVADAVVACVSWFLLVGGLRSGLALFGPHTGDDDAALLARSTGVPAPLWRSGFVTLSAGCVVAALALTGLLPPSLAGVLGA